tara:strand:+ start:972 stop:1418 length:447 start_codon:yes stop_codon:yes gene_type:complete
MKAKKRPNESKVATPKVDPSDPFSNMSMKASQIKNRIQGKKAVKSGVLDERSDDDISFKSDQNEIVKVSDQGKDSLTISADMDDSIDSLQKKREEKSKKREMIFRRKQTIKDQRSYIDKYIDNYWNLHIEGKDMSISEIDLAVHKLIH